MTWRQALTIALVMGFVAAGIVWFLEDYNLRRMGEEWLRFVEQHGTTEPHDG